MLILFAQYSFEIITSKKELKSYVILIQLESDLFKKIIIFQTFAPKISIA
jgi:hypothetical protein